jgi:hypothetical protein
MCEMVCSGKSVGQSDPAAQVTRTVAESCSSRVLVASMTDPTSESGALALYTKKKRKSLDGGPVGCRPLRAIRDDAVGYQCQMDGPVNLCPFVMLCAERTEQVGLMDGLVFVLKLATTRPAEMTRSLSNIQACS